MENNILTDIKKRIDNLDDRGIELTNKELALKKPVEDQNEKFEKLRKGYASLNLIDEEIDFTPITRELFKIELDRLKNKYSISNSELKYTKEDRDNIEKYFSELIPLYTYRWITICQYKKIWKLRRVELRKQENLLLENEYKNLRNTKTEINQISWKEQAKKVFTSHTILIEEQEKLITSEEDLQIELESIYRLKEEIFIHAHKLFEL